MYNGYFELAYAPYVFHYYLI